MFAKATKTRFAAVFAVMMLMLCSVAVIADADASPYGNITDESTDKTNQKFTLDISTDQQFVYDGITTNLSGVNYGTTKITWDAPSSGSSAVGSITLSDGTNGKKLSGSFSDAGTYTGILNAVWTASDGDKGELTQKASQTIVFNVTEKIDITLPSVAGYGMIGTAANTLIYSIPYTGDNATLASKYTSGSGEPFSFTLDDTNKKILVMTNKDLDAKGTWKANVTLTNQKSGSSDSVEITINVYEKVAITNKDVHYYSYEGSDAHGNGFTFIVTGDSGDGLEVTEDTITFNPDGTTVLSKDDSGSRTVKIDTVTNFTPGTPGSLIGEDSPSADYTATLNISTQTKSDGEVTGTSSDSATFTLTVYKSLAFLSSPKVATIEAKSISSNSNSVILSSYISGAKTVKFDWNDGTTSESVVTGSATNYSANHTYAKSGVYLITVTATNDMGTTTSKVMYAVGQDAVTTPTTASDTKDKGFFEEHGYLFLVFVLIVIGLLVAFFFFGIQHPYVLLAAIVCAILAVALYFYGDFSGIVDAIRGSK